MDEEKDTSKSGVMTFDSSLTVGRVGFIVFSEVFNLKTAKVVQGCEPMTFIASVLDSLLTSQ